MGDDSSEAFVDWFDVTEGRYGDYYPPGSRHDLEFRLSRKLMLAARRWTTFIDETVKARTGQPRARWQTLFALAFAGRPTTTLKLSERLGVQWPTLVRTLNALEAEGLVERVDNPDDGRSRLVAITAAGLALVERIQPILDPHRHEVVAALSDEEIVVATKMLHRLLAGATEARPLPSDPE